MKIICRIACGEDAEQLLMLNTLFNGPGLQTIGGIRAILQQKSTETVWIAEVDSDSAGFCCTQTLRSFCYTLPTVEITELFVKREYRRCGVASALLKQVEAHHRALGAEEIKLLTGHDNGAARALYERHGYIKEDEVRYGKHL